jgi:glycerophosphoryl diester phosphodiesterase
MLRIARRGAWGYAPENTLAAFRKATQIDCDVVEFDVHRTKDGHVVVMHDHNVRRTTDAVGNIHDLSLYELRRFHELNGESVPSLEEVVAIVRPKRRLMVDIKDHHMEELVLAILRRHKALDATIIDSDFADVIQTIRTLDRHILVYLGGVTPANEREVVQEARRIYAAMIKVKNTYVTPSLVRYAHQQGVGIYAWGAERVPDLKDLVDMGVDAIVCMFPDRIPPPKMVA